MSQLHLLRVICAVDSITPTHAQVVLVQAKSRLRAIESVTRQMASKYSLKGALRVRYVCEQNMLDGSIIRLDQVDLMPEDLIAANSTIIDLALAA